MRRLSRRDFLKGAVGLGLGALGVATVVHNLGRASPTGRTAAASSPLARTTWAPDGVADRSATRPPACPCRRPALAARAIC